MREPISIRFPGRSVIRGVLAALMAMAVIFAALPVHGLALTESDTLSIVVRHLEFSDATSETDREILAPMYGSQYMSVLNDLHHESAQFSSSYGLVEIYGVRISYDGGEGTLPARFAVTTDCNVSPMDLTWIGDGDYFLDDEPDEPCPHGFHLWLCGMYMKEPYLSGSATAYIDVYYKLVDDDSSEEGEHPPDCDCGEDGCTGDTDDDETDPGNGGLGSKPPGLGSGHDDDDGGAGDAQPSPPPQVYAPPIVYQPQVNAVSEEPIVDVTEEPSDEPETDEPETEETDETPEPIADLSVDPTIADFVGEVELPAELAGVVKAISVAPLHEDDFAVFHSFASGDNDAEPLFALTPVVFDLTVAGEDDAVIRELSTPIRVTLKVPEGTDATRLVLLTRHDGELKVITDFKICPDGKTITVALDKFSPFAVAHRNANVVYTDVGRYGTMNPSGEVPLKYGQSRVFTFSPQAGYVVGEVLLDGEPAQLRNDGALEVTCNEKPRTISVRFVLAPTDLANEPRIGDELELPGVTDPQTGLEAVPQADLDTVLEQATQVDKPPVIDLGQNTEPLVTENVGAVAEPPAVERSSLNLVFALLCLVTPFLDFFVSPVRRRAMKSTRVSHFLQGLLIAVGIFAFVLVTVLESGGSHYILVNARTPLFATLFALPFALFILHRIFRPRVEITEEQEQVGNA